MPTHKSLAFVALASCVVANKDHTTTTTPCTNKPTPSCTNTVCSDLINDCGQTYGGCFPNCDGYPTPTFVDPGCPTVTTSSSTLDTLATCTETICVDYINDCGQMYGGCHPICSGYPTPSYTAPPWSTTAKPTTRTTTRKPKCTKIKCVDLINDCGQMYGGCFTACKGHTTPSFVDPGCPTTTPTPSAGCNFVCSDFFDDCGNTYGPGCYTSCPGVPAPTYTTPVCTDAGTYTAN